MNIYRHRFFLCFIVFLAIFAYTFISVPYTAIGETSESTSSADSSSTGSSDSADTDKDDDSSVLPEWLVEAFKWMSEASQKIIDLLSDAGTFLWNTITKLIGRFLDDFLELFQNAFASAFIYTEPFSADSWVKDWWSNTLLLSIATCTIALMINAYKMFSGDSKNQSDGGTGKAAFKTVITAIGLSFFAFLIVRWGTNIQNNTWQQQLVSPIQSAYTSAGVSWDGQLSNVRSDMVLKGMLTGGNMSGIDVNQLDTMGISEVLYNPETDQGSFTMMLIMMFCLIFLAIIAMMHIWILALGLISSPLYMSIGSLKGINEPIVGIWDIILRSLFLQSLFAAFFMFTSDIRGKGVNALGGASPDLITLILFIVLCVLTYVFYLSRIMEAILSPGDLGGGKVIERTGNLAGKISEGAAGFAGLLGMGGKAIGSNKIQNAASHMEHDARVFESDAQRLTQWGQKLQKKGVNGLIGDHARSIQDRLKQNITSSGQPEAANTIESINESFTAANPDTHINSDYSFTDLTKISHENSLEGYKGFRVHPNIRDRAMQALEVNEDSIPQEACVWNVTGDQIWIHPSYAGHAEDVLKGVMEDNLQVRYWNKGDSYIILNDNIPIKVSNPPTNGIYMGVWK